MRRPTKQEQAAARIQRQYGVHVEYVRSNREYVVDTRSAGSSARSAERLARRVRQVLGSR